MSDQQENLGSFFKENARLVKEYVETRLEVYRLRMIRLAARSAGFLIWFVISLFLVFLLIIFSGIVLSLWLSDITGSFIAGFGITTLILFILILLLTAFRKALFINPIIRSFIRKQEEEKNEENTE
jgi:hypothetical protein